MYDFPDQYDDITQAFEKLTESGPRLSQTRLSSQKKATKREQMKLKESPIPEELLTKILLVCFVIFNTKLYVFTR